MAVFALEYAPFRAPSSYYAGGKRGYFLLGSGLKTIWLLSVYHVAAQKSVLFII